MPARPSFRPAISPIGLRIGLLSTYPPKLCGLATFAAALGGALRLAGNQIDVVRIDDGDGVLTSPTAPVVADLVNGDKASIRAAAAALSRCDVAIIQHEYGIYGGNDGDEVIDLLDALDVPAIVVLHTVPVAPTPNQKSVLEAVAVRADALVVMSETAFERLAAPYEIDRHSVVTIPHGAAGPTLERLEGDWSVRTSPQLLTWGLLGPGKGIEHAIDALGLLDDLPVRPRYTVTGVTHPKVFARFGDEYRHSLIQRASAAGLADTISFDDTYRNVAELTRFVASSSVVVLPYDSRDQVTSGVLVDAIAAGRPVIATAFPHAIELLSSGAGIVVPHGDPAALAGAIRAVVSDGRLLASMAAEARRLAPTVSWTAVAERYAQLSDQLVQSAEAIAI